uniref:Protein kinase domain-containing protein n=1 Tax=Oryza punctata TaxID=4537 RepID=A0A0E0KM42_ORYPU
MDRWCCEKQEFMLVYQYMHNGSLDKHLFEYSFLAWETRYRIVGDIAAGLHYIHHELDNVVIHRDIKSSNILLDHSLRGCLGDFGLAQVVARGRRSSSSTGTAGMGSASAAGTEGYIAPEYEASGKATVASDVYAFGVVILEIVTRREVFDDSQPSGSTHLVDWVRNEFHDKGKPLLEAVDRDLTGGGRWRRHDAAEAERLLLLGLACTSTDPSDRPITRDVLKIIDKTLPPPVVPPHRNIPRGASTRPTPVGGLGLPSISVHDADDASITITRSRFRRSIAFLCQGHMTFRSEEAQV